MLNGELFMNYKQGQEVLFSWEKVYAHKIKSQTDKFTKLIYFQKFIKN